VNMNWFAVFSNPEENYILTETENFRHIVLSVLLPGGKLEERYL
jgi:hypothetical protein